MTNWICSYYAQTHHWDGTPRKLEGRFAGDGDIIASCTAILNHRIKNAALWFGTGITICTPLGQKIERIIESDIEHPWYDIRLVEE